jgi:hypothetical protein
VLAAASSTTRADSRDPWVYGRQDRQQKFALLPEQITRRSRLLLPFALVARLEVVAQPSEPADLLPSRLLASPRGSNLPPFARFEVFASPGGSDDLIAKIAQPLQAIIDIEKPRLISHGIISDSPKTMESETNQIGELLEVSSFLNDASAPRKLSLAFKCKSQKAVSTLKVEMFGRWMFGSCAPLQQIIEGLLVIGQQHSIARWVAHAETLVLSNSHLGIRDLLSAHGVNCLPPPQIVELFVLHCRSFH